MNNQNYIEMPFKTAFLRFPELFKQLSSDALLGFMIDEKYIVRIDLFHKCLEIGYPSDNWKICH